MPPEIIISPAEKIIIVVRIGYQKDRIVRINQHMAGFALKPLLPCSSVTVHIIHFNKPAVVFIVDINIGTIIALIAMGRRGNRKAG